MWDPENSTWRFVPSYDAGAFSPHHLCVPISYQQRPKVIEISSRRLANDFKNSVISCIAQGSAEYQPEFHAMAWQSQRAILIPIVCCFCQAALSNGTNLVEMPPRQTQLQSWACGRNSIVPLSWKSTTSSTSSSPLYHLSITSLSPLRPSSLRQSNLCTWLSSVILKISYVVRVLLFP